MCVVWKDKSQRTKSIEVFRSSDGRPPIKREHDEDGRASSSSSFLSVIRQPKPEPEKAEPPAEPWAGEVGDVVEGKYGDDWHEATVLEIGDGPIKVVQ